MSVRKRTDVDWDGLRYFRAVAAMGTLTSAARRLRVEHTTVARQLDRLEAALGARLFLRNPRGYVLTHVGETILEAVEGMSGRVDEVLRLAGGEQVELTGSVRVATADVLATEFVLPALRPLFQTSSRLDVAIVSDTRQHDLSRREADLAVRLGGSAEAHLVVKHIARVGFGLYGERRTPKKIDLKSARYVTFDETVGRLPHHDWLAARAPGAPVVLHANRQQTLIEAVRLGVGLGVLPCMAADGDPALRRILGPSEVFSRDLYVVMHPDVRHTHRVRVVLEAIESYARTHERRVAGAA